jgi:hypothetical protein
MSDLGTTIDSGPTATGGEPTFQALADFIRRFSSLLDAVVIDLISLRELDDVIRSALRELVEDGTIRRYADQIVAAVDGRDVSTQQMLVLHGLADYSPDMTLKMATFDAAVRRCDYTETDTGVFTPVSAELGPGGAEVLDAVESVGSVFTVANAMLKSVSHAIPVAGAYGEVKDSVEAGIDLVGKAVRGIRGLLRRLRGRRG